MHFQKAFAFSISSAELPEKDTITTSAMMLLFSFPGMHGNKVYLAQTTHTVYAQLPLHL